VYTVIKLHDRRIPNVGVGVRVGPMKFQLLLHIAWSVFASEFVSPAKPAENAV